MLQLQNVLDRFEISIAEAVDLHMLAAYEILIIADDSGSMQTRDPGAMQNRWDELKDTLSLMVEVGGCFDATGIDLYFLNRPTVSGVTGASHPAFQNALRDPPRGTTPLREKLDEVTRSYTGGKPVLLIILTDGVPNGGPSPFIQAVERLVKKQSTQATFRVQIMACTGDDEAVGWINTLDKKYQEVDATDDYYTEKAEVLRSRRRQTFTRGDWCMKAMLGAISAKYDAWDEGGHSRPAAGLPAGNCADNCRNNCVIS